MSTQKTFKVLVLNRPGDDRLRKAGLEPHIGDEWHLKARSSREAQNKLSTHGINAEIKGHYSV